jgi:hypothetical protein
MHPFEGLSDDEIVNRHEDRLHKSRSSSMRPAAVEYYQIMAREYWKEIERRGYDKLGEP